MQYLEKLKNLEEKFENRLQFEGAYDDSIQRVCNEYDSPICSQLIEYGYNCLNYYDKEVVELKNKINKIEGEFAVDIWTNNENLICDEILEYLDSKLLEFIEEAYEESLGKKEEKPINTDELFILLCKFFAIR